MSDEFDSRSRILVVTYRSRVIGSTRLMFPQSESDTLKHEEYTTLPKTLPPKNLLVESSKTCTHPEFRGSDLLYYHFKHIVLTILQGQRRYLLMSCTDDLFSLYEKVGCHPLGISYMHPTMKQCHHVMLADIVFLAHGRGLNPLVWSFLDGPEVCRFASECGWISDNITTRTRIIFGKILYPLVTLHEYNRAKINKRERQ